jgi:hypothetical protein
MTYSSREKQPKEPPQRRARAEAVGRDASIAARAAFVRAGFLDPTLVLRWNEIAGRETARIARPLRLSEGPSGGVLTLRAEPAAALFLQHESRALCERLSRPSGGQQTALRARTAYAASRATNVAQTDRATVRRSGATLERARPLG